MSSPSYRFLSVLAVVVFLSSSLYGQSGRRRGYPGFSFRSPGFSMDISPRGASIRGVPVPSYSPRYRGFYPRFPVPAPPVPSSGDQGRDPVTGASDPFMRSPYRAMLEARRAFGIEMGLIAPAPRYDVPPLGEVEQRANEAAAAGTGAAGPVALLASVESLRRRLLRRGSGGAWIEYLQLDKIASQLRAAQSNQMEARSWAALLEPFAAVEASRELDWLSRDPDFRQLNSALQMLSLGGEKNEAQDARGGSSQPGEPSILEGPAPVKNGEAAPIEELPLPKPDSPGKQTTSTYRGEV